MPENFPSLRVVFYSDGSVKGFAGPLLERGIQVVSAREANAVAVADFCLAHIILSCKGYFRPQGVHRFEIGCRIARPSTGSR